MKFGMFKEINAVVHISGQSILEFKKLHICRKLSNRPQNSNVSMSNTMWSIITMSVPLYICFICQKGQTPIMEFRSNGYEILKNFKSIK